MKPLLQHLEYGPEAEKKIHLYRRVDDRFAFHWHHHPEYELTLITNSVGRRLVGDTVETYGPGDLVLLGPLLAHTWYSHEEYPAPHTAVVAQFHDEALGPWSEVQPLRQLLHRASGGLKFSGGSLPALCDAFAELPDRRGLPRITGLLLILDQLATDPAIKSAILSTTKLSGTDVALDDRIGKVLNRMSEHFSQPISQAEEAERLGMTPAGFARLFHRSVGKRFTEILHELRIGEACRLLRETNDSITDVAFASGFNNLSNFNRVFRRLKQMSPRDYRRDTAPPK